MSTVNTLDSMSVINIKDGNRRNNNIRLDHLQAAYNIDFSTSGFRNCYVIIINQNRFECFTYIIAAFQNNINIKIVALSSPNTFANNIYKLNNKVDIREENDRDIVIKKRQ